MIPMSAYLPYMPKRMATIKIMTDISKLFAKSSDIKILTGLKGAGLFITLLKKSCILSWSSQFHKVFDYCYLEWKKMVNYSLNVRCQVSNTT